MNIPQNEVIIIVRILIAASLGLLIGIQREKIKTKYRAYGSAGLRTHSLVCLSSALITSIGYVYIASDPVRLAASIMTGIGFLGAGTIIAIRGKIKGLTTAASIWAAASIGIAIGIGIYYVAITATILTMMIIWLKKLEKID